MKKYLHKKIVEVPIYGGHLLMFITNSVDKIRKELPNTDMEEVFAYTDQLGGSAAITLNFENPTTKMTAGVIAHEAAHATHMILSTRGVMPDFDNDEAEVYLLSWMVNQIHEFMNEHKFKASIHD